MQYNQGGDGTRYEVSGSEPGTEALPASGSADQPRRVAAGQPEPVVHRVRYPVLVPNDGGGYCITVRQRGYRALADAVRFDDEQQFRWMMLTADYPLCTGEAVPPESAPANAAEYWREVGEDLLPRPQPRIAPGYMLTGKPGYLESNSPPTARFEHDTRLGRLVIDARNTTWVDWGDGSGLVGPHDGPGAPWPSGTITHVWTHMATYDIRVVQRWTATWTLAGSTGRLAGLSTEGRIDDFEVRQLQAVRNR